MFFLVSRLNSLDKKLRISPHVYSFPFPPSFFFQKHYDVICQRRYMADTVKI